MSEVHVRVRANGPLLIEGSVELTDSQGTPFPGIGDKPVLALCRCGHSKNPPFCDGAHNSGGFESDPRAPQE